MKAEALKNPEEHVGNSFQDRSLSDARLSSTLSENAESRISLQGLTED